MVCPQNYAERGYFRARIRFEGGLADTVATVCVWMISNRMPRAFQDRKVRVAKIQERNREAGPETVSAGLDKSARDLTPVETERAKQDGFHGKTKTSWEFY